MALAESHNKSPETNPHKFGKFIHARDNIKDWLGRAGGT